MEISKRNDLVKPRLGQCLQIIAFQSEKKPPYFLLNARSHCDMTLGIPPFTEHHRTIRSNSGSNSHISSRLNQRMITPPAVSPAPTGEGAAAQSIHRSLRTISNGELTARCYHVLQTPHNRSLPSSCDKSFLEACGLQRSGQSSFPVAVALPSIGHVQVPSTSGSRRARPAK